MLSNLSSHLSLNSGQRSQSIYLSCEFPKLKPHFPIAVVPRRSSLSDRESLYESAELPKEARDFAALLASKVYYFLGEYDESLSFALGAGKAFEEETYKQGLEEYVETIVCQYFIRFARLDSHSVPAYTAKAIDRYILLRADAQPDGTPEIDPRLSAIIETIFNRCIADGEYKQVRAPGMRS